MSLPPMNSLPVFESVGRHQSVAKAAEELHLTPGAVSRQIKNLEEFLGCELFERTHRKIAFTREGGLFWGNVKGALAEIRLASAEISRDAEKRQLIIGCPRLFLQKCVMPELRGFYKEHPDIDVKFIVGGSDPQVDPDMDGQIGIGRLEKKSIISEELVACDLSPVCSPEYLVGNEMPMTVEELQGHTLLRSTEFTKNWRQWLGAHAADTFSKSRFIDFENAGLELSAALEGLGIAIVRLNLVKQEIENKELVVLLEDNIVRDHYSFSFPEAKLQSKNFKSFRRWLKQTLG